jgi:hypothetical protein
VIVIEVVPSLDVADPVVPESVPMESVMGSALEPEES